VRLLGVDENQALNTGKVFGVAGHQLEVRGQCNGSDLCIGGVDGVASKLTLRAHQGVAPNDLATKIKAAAHEVFFKDLTRGQGQCITALACWHQGNASQDFCISDNAGVELAGALCCKPIEHQRTGCRAHQFRKYIGIDQEPCTHALFLGFSSGQARAVLAIAPAQECCLRPAPKNADGCVWQMPDHGQGWLLRPAYFEGYF